MHPNTTHTHTGWVADVDAGMHPSVESRAREWRTDPVGMYVVLVCIPTPHAHQHPSFWHASIMACTPTHTHTHAHTHTHQQAHYKPKGGACQAAPLVAMYMHAN